MAEITQSYASRWRVKLMRSFLYSEWLYLAHQKSGQLISAITNETGRPYVSAKNCFVLANSAAALRWIGPLVTEHQVLVGEFLQGA